MTSQQLLGMLIVAFAGLVIGSGAWPMKLMKKFQFEHWWLIGMFTGLILIPWSVTLACCPNAFAAYASVPVKSLVSRTSGRRPGAWPMSSAACASCASAWPSPAPF